MHSYMKRFIICFIVFVIGSICVNAQTTTASDSLQLSPKDSLVLGYLDTFRSQLREPAYELYPTQNTWNFLKLNTVTGAITIVQFSLESKKRFEYTLDTSSRITSWDEPICGRFKLVSTQNVYNFLLLDQIDGRVWQVQWGFEEKDRFVTRIY